MANSYSTECIQNLLGYIYGDGLGSPEMDQIEALECAAQDFGILGLKEMSAGQLHIYCASMINQYLVLEDDNDEEVYEVFAEKNI